MRTIRCILPVAGVFLYELSHSKATFATQLEFPLQTVLCAQQSRKFNGATFKNAFTNKKKMKAKILAQTLDAHAVPLIGLVAKDYDYSAIFDLTENKRFVLIGEASHGTHEFYEIRAEITRRLIVEHGFTGVAVEADWPDAARVNNYVLGADPTIKNANDALRDFQRFPTWMWRNTEVEQFIEWLHSHNTKLPESAPKTGFYGLDLYSMSSSIEAVINYLENVVGDKDAAARARKRYDCFAQYSCDAQTYGMQCGLGMSRGCEHEFISQLKELQSKKFDFYQQNLQQQTSQDDGSEHAALDQFFSAEQNAKLITDAEVYYKAMFTGRPNSWNVRDTHMADTLDALAEHLQHKNTSSKPAKIVVWAHNSHLGDASATDMRQRREINVGQLCRQRHKGETCILGFSTFNGSVTAADDWDEPEHYKVVNDALPGSIEQVFHHLVQQDPQKRKQNFFLNLTNRDVREAFRDDGAVGGDADDKKRRFVKHLQRFIGVIYRQDTERASHYYHARLPDEFDGIIHIDKSTALHPLEPSSHWHTTKWSNAKQQGDQQQQRHRTEMDETFPTGL